MRAMTPAPTSKVTAVALAGAVVTVIVWAASPVVDVPPPVVAALTTIVLAIAGYFKIERKL